MTTPTAAGMIRWMRTEAERQYWAGNDQQSWFCLFARELLKHPDMQWPTFSTLLD